MVPTVKEIPIEPWWGGRSERIKGADGSLTANANRGSRLPSHHSGARFAGGPAVCSAFLDLVTPPCRFRLRLSSSTQDPIGIRPSHQNQACELLRAFL
jgi:hypothetical protein